MRLRSAALSTLVQHQNTLAANAISLLKLPDYSWINVIDLIDANAAITIMRIGAVVHAVMRMLACRNDLTPIRLSSDGVRTVESNTIAKRM